MNEKILTDFYFAYTLFSIRAASPADIPLIRELAMLVWPQTYVPIVGEPQVTYMLEQFYTPESLEKQMAAGHEFIICFPPAPPGEGSCDVPVAFASYSETEPAIYKLHKLYILPAMQGKGVGRFIIKYLAGELKKRGAKSLQLNVNRYNKNAIAFYEKTGFTQLRDEDIDIGNGYFMNDHVLGLALG